MYNISSLIGFFAVMIVSCILALIFAKKWFSWLLFLPGTIFTLISILGREESLKYNFFISSYQAETIMTQYWCVFFLLLVGTSAAIIAIFVKARKNAAFSKAPQYIVCDRCGREFDKKIKNCPSCSNNKLYL